MKTRRQYVTRHDGQYDQAVDISIPAVKVVMDLHEIQNQRECLLKVQRTFHHFLKKQNEGGE